MKNLKYLIGNIRVYKYTYQSKTESIKPVGTYYASNKNAIASDPERDKLCDFVKEYWHFDNITCMSEVKFINSYTKWAKKKRYQASAVKAKKIYVLALDGIPTLCSTTPSTKMLVLEAVKSLHMIDTTLINILAQMREITKALKEYEIVMSMPGMIAIRR